MFGLKKRKKKPKRSKKAMKERHWLVSVGGYDTMYTPPYTAISVVISLPKKETPLDWFSLKPRCFNRFEFPVEVMFGFWELTQEQYNTYYRKESNRLSGALKA